MATVLTHPTLRPRSFAIIIADGREAKADHEQAMTDADVAPFGTDGCDDAMDREREANVRREDLRDEARAKVVEALGVTVEELIALHGEGLL